MTSYIVCANTDHYGPWETVEEAEAWADGDGEEYVGGDYCIEEVWKPTS